jgi:hypothetical protein
MFPVLDAVRELIIIGERGEASTTAIRCCGERWRRAGKNLGVCLSPQGKPVFA